MSERREVYATTMWKNLRIQKLMKDPLCEVCLMAGRVTAGDHVHHLRSFTGIEDRAERFRVAYDIGNLMTVCDRCHGRIHGGDLTGCSSREDIEKRIKT